MGQQQLLLLVLGIVIVGLAVVVGIQAFGENQKKANSDALVNDAIRLASDAQAWKLKPAAFGGGANITGWTGIELAQLGYVVDAQDIYTNLNGNFSMEGDQNGVTIIGCSIDAYGPTDNATYNRVEVTVVGTSPEDITTEVTSPETCETSAGGGTN